MRVGVVGCGYWGSNHVRVLSAMPSVAEVVLIDARTERLESVGRNYPRSLRRASLTAALDDVDAVVVATQPDAHFEVAAEAIAAGKHVLVEKPMATTKADAEEMVRLATEAGVTLAAGHTFAYNAAVWKLTSIVQRGELGRLHYLDAARLNLGLYRDDVNVLWDLAAHDISITTALLRDVPDRISAWGSRHTSRFGEDVATMRMLFDRRQVESTVRVSWLDPLKVRRTTVVGSEKMAVYNDLDTDQRIKIFDRGRMQHADAPTSDPFSISYRYGDITSPHIEFGEPLRFELEDFLRCCSSGAVPVANGLAGLTVVAVLEASDASLRENGALVPLELPDLAATMIRAVA
ncbi:MAG: Gfo/Idh/MocA family oxidoreductase [Acidimicrobiia bacterium]|nr:Gfo/Idh/MocA family oxidoreductase [Acidimicrobiia bacterium]